MGPTGAWRPNAKRIDVSWSSDLGVQHWFLIELTDASGGTAYLSPVRSLPRNAYIRCGDRQNWFSSLSFRDVTYTGRTRAATKGPTKISVPGVTLAADCCPKLEWVYSGQGFVIHDFTYDRTLVPGTARPGTDNAPIFNDLPIPEYAGRLRYVSFMTGRRMNFREYIAEVTLKSDLTPKGQVWPVLGSTLPGAAYVYTDARTGQRVAGKILKDNVVDLPPGAVVGNVLLLTPARVSSSGEIGFALPTGVAKAGST